MKSPSVLPSIVVAEDSADDLFFLKRRLKQAGIENPVLSFENGRQAIEFLAQGSQASADGKPLRPPCLILLDIKMPVMSGLEVLAWARSQLGLAGIPIVMLSGSTAASDIARARELGATEYLIKPPSIESLAALARQGFCSGEEN
jgi:CheY-like chemotaxis protein